MLYINDIVDLFGDGLSAKLFADDVKIYGVINDVYDVIRFQAGLDALNFWSAAWQLPVSVKKCAVLHLGRNNNCNNYALNDINLPNVDSIIDLGIMIDNKLRFNKHYRQLVNKAQYRASLIFKSFFI